MIDSRGTAGLVVALPARPLDERGTAVAEGRTPSGTTLAVEDLEVRSRRSSSVVRGVRVPESLGMVTSRRRVGLTMQPTRGWNVHDRRVICGRPTGGCGGQVRSLTAAGAAGEAVRALPAETAAGKGVTP